MQVKSYKEASKAIQDIVHNAKIPVITMIAILEATKFQLLSNHNKVMNSRDLEKFFTAIQKEAEERAATRGVH